MMMQIEVRDIALLVWFSLVIGYALGWIIAFKISWTSHQRLREKFEAIDAGRIAELTKENGRLHAACQEWRRIAVHQSFEGRAAAIELTSGKLAPTRPWMAEVKKSLLRPPSKPPSAHDPDDAHCNCIKCMVERGVSFKPQGMA